MSLLFITDLSLLNITESPFPYFLVLNIILAITIIFLERKDPSSTWAWILVLFFLPLAGFILYLLLGRPIRKKHLFRWEGQKDIGIDKLISYQIEALESNVLEFNTDDVEKYKNLIHMNLKTGDSVLTQDNQIRIFDEGSKKFETLIEDILNAKDHIHIQYYIFKLDNLGGRIYTALKKKAKQGVKVRVLYDEMGSRSLKKETLKSF